MSEKKRLLIVDDEFNTREALMRYLGRRFDVTGAADGSEAIDLLCQREFDLVLTDLRMPGADGMSVLDATLAKTSRPPCILLTAYGSIGDAVQAVKKGAFDFVAKPVKLDRLEAVIRTALDSQKKSSTGNDGVSDVIELKQYAGIVGLQDEHDPMKKVFDTALKVAPSKSTVMITGESGTGKEVVARFIHDHSRRTGLFIPVHCAALTSTLLESELFGYEKGAFTGANERRRGRFELADGGTIFLDEIGEIDLATQVKLLRVLETRAFERVGGTETIHSDVRLIAATNRNLREMVGLGTFREDLFYRLSVINLELPPLRSRRMEIPALIKQFLREFAHENQQPIPEISPAAIDKLVALPWPGNIRELRNCMECMVALSGGVSRLEVENLPKTILEVPNTAEADERVESLSLKAGERELIIKALSECHGNRTAAAKLLGISRRTLYRKLETEGLDDDFTSIGSV